MQNDEQAIRQLVLNWSKATENGDAEQIVRLIADDAIFLTAGHPPMNKEDFAAALAGLKGISIQVDNHIQEIVLMGDFAYCWNKLTVKVTPPHADAPVTRAGSSLSILRKQDGTWVLMRDANMLSVVSP